MPGPGGHRGEFTAWDPVSGKKVVGDQGELPGLERRARHRGRRRLLRHDGRLVQGGRRAAPASCCGSSRSAPGSSASRSRTAGRTASSTSPCSPASAAGPARSSSGDLDPRDGARRARLRQRDERPAAAHDQGRHAVCFRACLRRRVMRRSCSQSRRSLRSVRWLAAAPRDPARPPTLRVCADPDNLPFSNAATARASRTASPSSLAATCDARARVPGGRSGAASCARR